MARRGFTLIELLVICAILATMTAIGVGSIVSGQGMARVKGATRDVYAAIRHARSVALVTGQRVLVNYSNETIDDEPSVKIDVVAAKIMSADSNRAQPQPYYVMDYKELPTADRVQKGQKLVNIRGADAKSFAEDGTSEAGGASSEGGETIEEILFSPMSASVVKGMRILVKKGDEVLTDETAVQKRSRISTFSNVDLLPSLYKGNKDKAADKNGEPASSPRQDEGERSAGSVNDMDETVSVVWETNGAVEPHRIWIYPDGKKPEDGLLLNIDSFGAVKVLGGDGREED